MTSDYSDTASGIVGISYVRSADGKQFKYECKSNGRQIVWRGVDLFRPGEGPGRWRDEDAASVQLFQ